MILYLYSKHETTMLAVIETHYSTSAALSGQWGPKGMGCHWLPVALITTSVGSRLVQQQEEE